MNDVTFPTGYQQVMPYLILPQPQAFLQFTKEVLGAVEKMILRNEDGSLGHCEVTVGQSVIMFSGCSGQWDAQPAGLYVYVPDVDTAYEKALQLGAISVMPVSNQSYGRSGGVRDENGNTWWLVTAPVPGD